MTSGGSTDKAFADLAASVLRSSRDACPSEHSSPVFRIPASISSTSLRSWLFENLKSDAGHQRMDDVLIRLGGSHVSDDLSHAYSDYMRARWFPVTVCILALVVFLLSIVLCCSVSKRFRRFLRKIFCCTKSESASSSNYDAELPTVLPTNEGTRTKYIQAKPSKARSRNQIVVLILSIVLCLGVWVVVGFGIHGAVELCESQRVIRCNMWQQLNGYYNGAENLAPAALHDLVTDEQFAKLVNVNINEQATGREMVARVTSDWPGSVRILEQLNELARKTLPGTDNPLYKNFTENREALQTDVEAYEAKVRYYLDAVDAYINVYDTALAELKTALEPIASFGAWNAGYSFVFTLKKVFLSKKKVFKDEVATASASAWPILDALIEKYVGASAQLLQNANEAVQSALDSIDNINHSMHEMYNLWKPMNSKIRGGVIVLLVLAAVAGVSAIIATALAIHMFSHLIRRSRQSKAQREAGVTVLRNQVSLEEEIQDERLHRSRCWLWASTFCGIALALSAFLVGVCFLTSAIGADACDSVDQSVMTNGRWDLLGNKILHPVEKSSFDMRGVLDTCVKRGSSGSIAKTLGLDASVSQVSDQVAAAIDDINDTRDEILLKNYRHMRVEIIGFLIKELLRGFAHETHYRSDSLVNGDRVPSFDRIQELNFENHTSSTEGRRVLLAPIPYWPSMVNSMVDHGLLYTLGSIVDAYNMLNSVSDLALAANPDSKVPRFCGALAQKRLLACSYFKAGDGDPREIVDLADYKTNTQAVVDSWLTTLDADVPSMGVYEGNVMSRTRQLIGATIYVEAAANREAQSLGFASSDAEMSTPVCENQAGEEVPCTFDDVRQVHQGELDGVWKNVSESYEAMIARVDTYVDELVIPASQELVQDANNVIVESNCQFQGSELDSLVYAPLCWTFFPILTGFTFLAFVLFCVMLFLQIILWSCESDLNHYTGQGYHAAVIYNDGRSASVYASKEHIRLVPNNNNLMVPPPHHGSVSSASYQDSVRQFGSEAFVPIFSPLRVHHYN